MTRARERERKIARHSGEKHVVLQCHKNSFIIIYSHLKLGYEYIASSSTSSTPRNLSGVNGVIGLSVVPEYRIGLSGGLSKSILFHRTPELFSSTSVGADPRLPTLHTVSNKSPFSHELACSYRSKLFLRDLGKYDRFWGVATRGG